MNENSSAKLLQRYQSGSETAPLAIHERYRTRLIGLARTQLMNVLSAKVDPEDIAQETFHVFFDLADRNEIRWKTRGDLWRLLAGIASNKVKQTFETHSAAKRNASNEVAFDDHPTGQSPGDAESCTELAELLEHILDSEKPLTKVIVEFRLAGYSQTEIAEKVGRSTRTIRRLLDSLQAKLIADHDLGFGQFFKPNKNDQDVAKRAGSINVDHVNYKDFQLLRMIGQGSFAKVYLAKHITTGELFAIKAVRKKWLADPAVRDCFMREAALLTQIEDPNVIRTFGIGQLPNGGSFLLLEWIDGKPMSRMIKSANKQQSRLWLEQISTTMGSLHRQDIIHGDLRLDNILIDSENRVRIIDFGFGFHRPENTRADRQTDLDAIQLIAKEVNQ